MSPNVFLGIYIFCHVDIYAIILLQNMKFALCMISTDNAGDNYINKYNMFKPTTLISQTGNTGFHCPVNAQCPEPISLYVARQHNGCRHKWIY